MLNVPTTPFVSLSPDRRHLLLVDPDHQIADAYGAWGEKLVNGEITEGLVRSTVVLDTEGNVVLAQYQVKAQGHVAALKETLGV